MFEGAPLRLGEVNVGDQARDGSHCSFAYCASACLRMGTSASAERAEVLIGSLGFGAFVLHGVSASQLEFCHQSRKEPSRLCDRLSRLQRRHRGFGQWQVVLLDGGIDRLILLLAR
jgi:hypothetical protein